MFLIRAPIISLAEEPARSSCSQRCGCSGTVRARRRDRSRGLSWPASDQEFLRSLQLQLAALIEHGATQGDGASGAAGRQFRDFERGIKGVVGIDRLQ